MRPIDITASERVAAHRLRTNVNHLISLISLQISMMISERAASPAVANLSGTRVVSLGVESPSGTWLNIENLSDGWLASPDVQNLTGSWLALGILLTPRLGAREITYPHGEQASAVLTDVNGDGMADVIAWKETTLPAGSEEQSLAPATRRGSTLTCIGRIHSGTNGRCQEGSERETQHLLPSSRRTGFLTVTGSLVVPLVTKSLMADAH